MFNLLVRLTAPQRRQRRTNHPKAVLINESGLRFELPLAPKLSHRGLAPRHETYDRVQRKPVLVQTGWDLRTYNLTMVVAGRDRQGRIDNQVSVERQLQILRALARNGERVQWRNFGASEGGWFKITRLDVDDRQRKHGSNDITIADVSLELTEAIGPSVNQGPTSGGAKKPAGAKPAAADPQPSGQKTYTVKSGDTLWKIAHAHYGNGSRYPEIADANKIANPHLIHPGQKLVIP